MAAGAAPQAGAARGPGRRPRAGAAHGRRRGSVRGPRGARVRAAAGPVPLWAATSFWPPASSQACTAGAPATRRKPVAPCRPCRPPAVRWPTGRRRRRRGRRAADPHAGGVESSRKHGRGGAPGQRRPRHRRHVEQGGGDARPAPEAASAAAGRAQPQGGAPWGSGRSRQPTEKVRSDARPGDWSRAQTRGARARRAGAQVGEGDRSGRPSSSCAPPLEEARPTRIRRRARCGGLPRSGTQVALEEGSVSQGPPVTGRRCHSRSPVGERHADGLARSAHLIEPADEQRHARACLGAHIRPAKQQHTGAREDWNTAARRPTSNETPEAVTGRLHQAERVCATAPPAPLPTPRPPALRRCRPAGAPRPRPRRPGGPASHDPSGDRRPAPGRPPGRGRPPARTGRSGRGRAAGRRRSERPARPPPRGVRDEHGVGPLRRAWHPADVMP